MAKRKKPTNAALRDREGEIAYDWVKVQVTGDGILIDFHRPGCAVDGNDMLEDPSAKSWPTADVLRMVADMLEIHDKDQSKIQVT